jgi:hypothetical protein
MPNILVSSNVLHCNQEVLTISARLTAVESAEFKSQRNNCNWTRWSGIETKLMTSCRQNLKNQSFVSWHLLEVLDAIVSEKLAVSFFRVTANSTYIHTNTHIYIHTYTHTHISLHKSKTCWYSWILNLSVIHTHTHTHKHTVYTKRPLI